MFMAHFRLLKALLAFWAIFFVIGSAAAEKVKFVILATADIHGRSEQLAGAVAPLVKNEFAAADGHAVYVDTGDAAQGSYAVNHKRGKGFLKLLNDAGCTLFVPGNHELEFGFEAFKVMIREFPGTVLAANLHAPELKNHVRAYKIVSLNGVKVAFIGLMLKNMNNCFPVAQTRFQTLPSKVILRKCVAAARHDGAEFIVLLRHAGKYGGGENLIDLVKSMPEIDLVIGAHTHKAEAGCKMGNVWYVQPPAHGNGLVKTVVYFDKKRRQTLQMESELLLLEPLEIKIPQHALQAVQPTGNDNNFAAKRIRKALKSDLAIYSVSSMKKLRDLMQLKNPQLIDYYHVFKYFDPMITVRVTPDEMRMIFREYIRLTRQRKHYMAVDGFRYDAPHGKLRWIDFNEEKSVYTLAISAYAAAGGGGQLPQTRRILKNKIDHQQAEAAEGVLELITGKGYK